MGVALSVCLDADEYHPSFVPIGHGRPWAETLREFLPQRDGMSGPEHLFHQYSPIDDRALHLPPFQRQKRTNAIKVAHR